MINDEELRMQMENDLRRLKEKLKEPLMILCRLWLCE